MEDELATVDYEGSERSALTTPRSCTTPRSLFGDLTPRTVRSFLDDQDAELLAAAAAVEPLPAGHQAISKQAKGLVVAASPVDTANVKGAKATPKAKPKAKPKASPAMPQPEAAAPPEIHSPTPTDPSSEVRDPTFTEHSYGPRSTVVRSGPRFADPIFDSDPTDPTSSSENSWRTDTMEWVTRDCWACSSCKSMNLRFVLVCVCGVRRQLREDWNWAPQKNDWICDWCSNYNFSWRRWCHWSDCPTGDWECVCGNVNYQRRRVCNRSSCQRPRPW